MADDSNPTDNADETAPTLASGPDTNNESGPSQQPQELQIAIAAQYVKDLSFEVPGAPDILGKISGQPPQVKFNMDVRTNRIGEPGSDNEAVEVCLSVGVESAVGDQTIFIAEMQYCGICPIAKIPVQARRYVLLVEIPRLLFPFARATISSVIVDSGFPAVMIQPVDFAAQYRLRLQKEAAAQAAQSGGPDGGKPNGSDTSADPKPDVKTDTKTNTKTN